MERHDSHHGVANALKSRDAPSKHFKDWPNAAGFNATGDTKEPIQLQVTGSFPAYAAGTLYRVGPSTYRVAREKAEDGEFVCSHWFDGFTTVYKFDLSRDGNGSDKCSQVCFSSYSQVDEMIEKARKTGRLDGITFGQGRDPCDSFFRKLKTVFSPVSSPDAHYANIAVTLREALPAELTHTKKSAGDSRIESRRLLTLTTDATTSKQFDAHTLEPLGVAKQTMLHPLLSGPMSAAHAAHDAETGDIFNYNLAFGKEALYRIFRASPQGEVEILAEISGSDIPAAYLHSLHLTPNFVVLCIWPALISGYGLSVLWHRNVLDALAPFDPKARATWCVVDRRHGRGLVKKFQSPAFFAFHTVNAWEEARADDPDTVDVVCEQVEFDSLDVLHKFYYKNLVSNEANVAPTDMNAALVRHRLDRVPKPATTTTTLEPKQTGPVPSTHPILRIPSPRAGDLPTINPRFACRPHRYVYALLSRGRSSFVDGLGKTDTQTGTCAVWERTRHTPGEPVFIPASAAAAAAAVPDEDEGVVLSVVLDGDVGTSYLLCLDARTMREVGRAEVPTAVGFGFHGMHVPAS